MIRRTIAIALLFISISTIILVPIFTLPRWGNTSLMDLPQHLLQPLYPLHQHRLQNPLPILTVKGTLQRSRPARLSCLDNDTGHILDDQNGERPVPMASTTKIMTALIAIQAGDLNKVVTIHQDAINEAILNNGSSAKLQVGDQLTLRDLLYGLMLPSGDDASIAIAECRRWLNQPIL